MKDITGYQELEHPIVKLEAEADLRMSSWAEGTTLKNNIPTEEIQTLLGETK